MQRTPTGYNNNNKNSNAEKKRDSMARPESKRKFTNQPSLATMLVFIFMMVSIIRGVNSDIWNLNNAIISSNYCINDIIKCKKK
jgi:hypothetical protein